MILLRSVAAIVAGFGFTASTVMVGTILATALFIPGGLRSVGAVSPLPPSYLAANLAISLFGAVLGGWLAARIAAYAPFGHAVVLAALLAAMTVASAYAEPAARQPGWYPYTIAAIGVCGVLAGGWLRSAASAGGGPPASSVIS
jgi:hypothetical protein